MELTKEQIKRIEELTGYEYVLQEPEITYQFNGTEFYNHVKCLDIFLSSQPEDSWVSLTFNGDERAFPIKWLKPLSQILEGEKYENIF